MNTEQLTLLEAYEEDKISLDELDFAFEQKFGIDLYQDTSFLDAAIDHAIVTADKHKLHLLINILWIVNPPRLAIDTLHKLLLYPHHNYHQAITKQIQHLADPSSVPYIDEILSRGFGDFTYTCSEDAAIAKWFSWALFSIGTKEAIACLEKYAKSSSKEMATEMEYRLSKL